MMKQRLGLMKQIVRAKENLFESQASRVYSVVFKREHQSYYNV